MKDGIYNEFCSQRRAGRHITRPLAFRGRELPESQYALWMSQNLAGPQGEMTAVYQYLYQNWVLRCSFPEIAAVLVRISKVEMHHLDIFGQVIGLLGGEPRCQARPNVYRSAWSGNMINYTKDLRKMLSYNMFLEQTAVDTYTKLACSVQDDCLSAILNRVAQDEQVHVHIYQDLLDML